MSRLRGYYLTMDDDDEAGGAFVVAHSAKDAKSMFMELDCIKDYDDWFLRMRVKWDKKADISGLDHGTDDNSIGTEQLIKRNILSTIFYAQCPKCEKEDCTVSEYTDGIISCSDCADKREENK